jgi:hypothetical protein
MSAPYMARQMSRLTYVDIGDEHNPILLVTGNGGVSASMSPLGHFGAEEKHTQSTHVLLWWIILDAQSTR